MQKEEKETTPRKHNEQLKHTVSSVEPRNAMFSVCLLVSSGWSVLFNMFVLLFTTLCCQVLPICLPRKSTPRTTICYMCVGFPRLVCLFLLCIVSTSFSWFSTFLHKCGTRTDSARFAHVCVCVCARRLTCMSACRLCLPCFTIVAILVLSLVPSLARRVHITTCSSSFMRCNVHLVC